jgi:hypothetical protein
VIQRKTQNLAFWRNEYQVDDSDHEFLYEYLVDSHEPQRVEDLAMALIRRRCRLEENRIRAELERGLIYDPAERYKVGDEVVFPAFDFAKARVVSVRPGENPEHGAFEVIGVRFDPEGRERYFAAALKTPHGLNRRGRPLRLDDDKLLSPEEIYAEVGPEVIRKVEQHLRSHPELFAAAGPLWLTTDHMVAVTVGHLNIAEAAIETEGQPLSTAALLDILELAPEASATVRTFSLETALYADERFVQVGRGEESLWYLRRLMPPEALAVPAVLAYRPEPYPREALDVALLQAEWELADEWTEGGLAETATAVPSTVVLLTYPHWAAGTLPLPPAARAIFPRGRGLCSAVTLIDGRWGTRFPAWVMHEGRYVAGLGPWYNQHKLPIGTRIVVERTEEPHVVRVDYRPIRPRREWLRAAGVEDGRLVFGHLRVQVNCEYDEHVALLVPDPDAIAELRDRLAAEKVTVSQLVQQIMPELIKLSPQGTAHVKALYSAVNVVRRLPPGPIFAALARLPGATDTGSGYWSI